MTKIRRSALQGNGSPLRKGREPLRQKGGGSNPRKVMLNMRTRGGSKIEKEKVRNLQLWLGGGEKNPVKSERR